MGYHEIISEQSGAQEEKGLRMESCEYQDIEAEQRRKSQWGRSQGVWCQGSQEKTFQECLSATCSSEIGQDDNKVTLELVKVKGIVDSDEGGLQEVLGANLIRLSREKNQQVRKTTWKASGNQPVTEEPYVFKKFLLYSTLNDFI